MKRKKVITITAIFSALFVSAAALGIALFVRPDWRFVISEALSHMGGKAEFKKLDENMLRFSDQNNNVTYDQSLLLINPDNLISEDISAEVEEYKNSTLLFNSCIIDAYSALSYDISEKFGEKLLVMSAYRSTGEQETALLEEGDKAAGVGESEHQMGLALDVYVKMYAGAGFLKSEVGRYVNANCWRYGFIIRYPYFGKSKTGIGFEPWHIRYVGMPHAEIIYKNSLTLEEYIESLELDAYYEYGDYIITRRAAVPVAFVHGYNSAVISPDNTGNYIITVKR